MGLLVPWFLAGAAAVALPFYLHLLRHRHADTHPFASLMFFERRSEGAIRRRRLRYLLLLSFRVALLALLALAFAQPFIHRLAASPASNKLLLLVIDNSFSMRAGSRLADARREALSVLASRKASGRAEIMTLGSQLHALTPPTEDLAALRAAVRSVQPTDSRASFAELAHALRPLAESLRAPIELHLFSDMQRSGMPPSFTEMALPANVSLVLHPVVRSTEPNWTVASVNAPSEVWDPKKAPVRAVVAGYHTPAATRTVSLIVNGRATAVQKVQVPADGRATVEFPALDVPFGFSRCEVRIDSADSLPADDVALFGVQRSDPKRVLFVHQPGDARSPLYFGTALEAAAEPAFRLEVISVDKVADIKPSAYAFVVLSDVPSLPPSFQRNLAEYVTHGGSVLVAAGTSAAAGYRIPVFGGNVLGSRSYAQDGADFRTLGEADRSNPSIEKAGGWPGVKFYFVVHVNDANSQVIARLTDQTPVLLEKSVGEGHVLLLASGLDNVTNDFPLHPAFVPFVEQTARYLSGLESIDGAQVVGSQVELKSGKQPATSVEVVGPDRRRAISLEEAASARSFRLTHTGFYEFHRAGGYVNLVGVNPDRRESDLEVMPEDILSLWRGGNSRGEQASQETPAVNQVRSYDLWWYVMLLVLAAALAESLLASRYLGKLRDER